MIIDSKSSLRSRNFFGVGGENTGPTSYARTFECAWLVNGFECTVDLEVACVFKPFV